MVPKATGSPRPNRAARLLLASCTLLMGCAELGPWDLGAISGYFRGSTDEPDEAEPINHEIYRRVRSERTA